MKLHRAKAGLVLLGVLSITCLSLGQPPAKDGVASDDKQVVDSKANPRPPGSAVNFRKELNLPFESLGTLRSRISAARRASDPVALAHAAGELSVAEQVSGKKASLTSNALIKEAAELARLRKQAAELQAVQRVTEKIANEQDLIALLRNEIAQSKQISQLDSEAFRRNEEPSWTPRKVLVNNFTPQSLVIYVNGFIKMPEVPPGGAQIFVIEHRWNPTVLKATGDEDVDTWGPRYIWGQYDKYTWNIN
jgi:hypothetical protein